MSALSQFATFFQGGGPFMFVILGVGVVMLAMALERGELTEVVKEFETFDAQEEVTLGGVEGQLLRFETYRARGNELLADEALARAVALGPDRQVP